MPVQCVSDATHMELPPATQSFAGMVMTRTTAGTMTKATSPTPKVWFYAPTGSCLGDAAAPRMTPDMNALGVVKLTMGPRDALSRRRLEPLMLLCPTAWHEMLACTNLAHKYPLLTHHLTHGFNASIPHIPFTYTPANNLPTHEHLHAFQDIVDNEFRKGR